MKIAPVPSSGRTVQPVDVAFLIGASKATTKESWQKMLAFVNSLVDGLAINQRGTHVGAIAFDENARVELAFGDLKGSRVTAQEVKRVIAQIPYRHGDTRFDRALRLANSKLFTEEAGARPYASKVILGFVSTGY